MIKTISIETAREFVSTAAQEQEPFLTEKFFSHGEKYALGYFIEAELSGVIGICKQVLGEEQGTPEIMLGNKALSEAKVIAFAVKQDARNKGIGKELQLKAISLAKELDCYQLASYSTFDKAENYRVKSSLGFSIQPEVQQDGTMGCYFLKTL